MSFAEMLLKFQHEIKKQYGDDCEITKLGVNYPLMDAVAREHFSSGQDMYSFHSKDLGELIIVGVPIVARRKEKF